MIIAGVGLIVLAARPRRPARRPQGRRRQRQLPRRRPPLASRSSAAALMGRPVDSNATLGNTDLSSSFGFWAGVSLALGLASACC